MKYIIDDANIKHIEEVMAMGIKGITANPSMYVKNDIHMHAFLKHFKNVTVDFISAEAMGETIEDMLEEVKQIHTIIPNAVIKVNFSPVGLKLCNVLHNQGIKTAMTLVFTLGQVAAAIQANVDYIFFFIGRNEEHGFDGLSLIETANEMCKQTNTHIVAASIKHMYHLQQLCEMNIAYAAIPYQLYKSSLLHQGTDTGRTAFEKDWLAMQK